MTTVMITGANRGIGLGLVEHYLKSGRSVIASCRHPDRAEKLQALASSGSLTIVAMDVGDNQAIDRVAAELKGRGVDLLINNAGIGGGQHQSFQQVDPTNWIQVLRINALSPLFVTRAMLPNLKLAPQAKVAVISSQLGALSYPNIGLYPYESSKAAANKVMKGMAVDLKPDGIAVFAMHPGWVKTDMGGANAEISVATSATGIAKTLEGLTLVNTGTFWRWDGKEHQW